MTLFKGTSLTASTADYEPITTQIGLSSTTEIRQRLLENMPQHFESLAAQIDSTQTKHIVSSMTTAALNALDESLQQLYGHSGENSKRSTESGQGMSVSPATVVDHTIEARVNEAPSGIDDTLPFWDSFPTYDRVAEELLNLPNSWFPFYPPSFMLVSTDGAPTGIQDEDWDNVV